MCRCLKFTWMTAHIHRCGLHCTLWSKHGRGCTSRRGNLPQNTPCYHHRRQSNKQMNTHACIESTRTACGEYTGRSPWDEQHWGQRTNANGVSFAKTEKSDGGNSNGPEKNVSKSKRNNSIQE